MINKKNQSGVTIIAAIFIIVVLGFMGVMFLTMINTGSFTAVNDIQSAQALYVAEGGVEYEQRNLAQNLNWYRSATDPLYNDAKNLGGGGGSFTATARVPATLLRKKLLLGDATASVYTTSGFPPSGFLQIDDDVAGGAEYVQYTVLNATTFTLVARGQSRGTINTVAGDFVRGTAVYPVTTLVDALLNSSNTPTTFRIAANPKFLSAGTLDIEGEEISYSGSSTAGGNTTLTGIQRCVGPTPCAAHAVGQPATPLLMGGVLADVQSEVTSTGAVGVAVRTVKKTVLR